MGRKPVLSLNFLRRRSKALLGKNSVVDEMQSADRCSKTSLGEIQMDVFFSDVKLEKVKVVPIATPPPSPPTLNMASKLSCSMSTSSMLSTRASVAEPLTSPLPSPGEKLGGSLESILDRGTRVSFRLEPASSHMEAVIETGAVDDTNSSTSIEYSVVNKRPKKKKRKKGSESSYPMSPPHTPPPLPPQLTNQSGGKDVDEVEDEVIIMSETDKDDKEEVEELSTCLRCGCHLPYSSPGKSSSFTTTQPMASQQDEPIYHILEKPLLCESCVRNSVSSYGRGVHSRELPPSPPLPTRGIRRKDPVYESVEFFKPYASPKEGEEEKRRAPLSLECKLRSSSSSDYESIPSFENSSEDNQKTISNLDIRKRPSLAQLKTVNSCSSDYESIPSFDMDTGSFKVKEKGSGISSSSLKRKESTDSSHDYETIEYTGDNGEPNYAHIPAVDDTDLESPDRPFVPDGATRAKLLKIDSAGYASVLYPQEVDESWEFDCLNQDKDSLNQQETNSSVEGSSVTVQNSEEAWKHQLVKGYAPLTLQREPPPIFSRTRSAPNTSLPKLEPRDYEVPRQIVPPPLPPISQRRINRAKHAVCSNPVVQVDDGDKERHLRDVPECLKRLSKKEEAVPSTGNLSVIAEDQTGGKQQERVKMRSRIMTVPATVLGLQKFT